jgi:uncharacterized protein
VTYFVAYFRLGMTVYAPYRLWLILVCLYTITVAAPQTVRAASFDCTKAASAVEKLICSDAEISKLDDDLAATYAARGRPTGDQRRWLGQRNACKDRECIKNAYSTRLTQLQINAKPPQSIFGTYTRLTPTCGWPPGDADRPARVCTMTFPDTLEVAPAIALDRSSADSVHVSFGLHFDIGQYYFCTFQGSGTWVNGKVVLDQPTEPLIPAKSDPACLLTLSFSMGVVRLSDARQKCQPSLCNGPTNLNGVSYTKEGKPSK